MQRVYEPYAYSDAPLEACVWNDVPSPAPRPALDGAQRCNVAIIGGGFTGLSAALHLAEQGADVRVLEAKRIGWGASGRNGGFCCLGGGKISSAALVKRHGIAGRQAYRDAEKAAVALVADLLDRHNIRADRQSRGETVLAHTRRAMKALRSEVHGLNQDYGVTPDLHEADELPGLGMGGRFFGGLTLPIGFGLNPRKYVHSLARAAEAAGAVLHDASPVTAIREGFTLITPTGKLTARRLILATNGYSSDDIPDWLRARYLPLQSNVLATRPLTNAELAAQGWTSDQMAYDTRHLLHYFRLLPDRRFLFGMRGGVYATPRAMARLRRKIHADFNAMFPEWRDVERPHFWNGLVCLARNRTPFIGPIPEMPGAFAGFAFHGNGVAMGSYAGRLLADLALDKTPDQPFPTAFATPPARFPLGRLRRALLTGINAALTLADL
ncbi:FAD-binding oxidoreductase [Primorskyibacter aestuariivivens]|uniref:NAD(P)/FAD-dependent oxidoreductase n=1 Tax=Primorskyibacter aestuariivivens TaxID=1888912 RepID=UPI0023005755|nr:FAD-binding oxidoreductase [Primorskyibacter aestuariivivens]MDA7427769.1 FAD-binding oxidoreductase [Primorskyibacter aestuariivivens]